MANNKETGEDLKPEIPKVQDTREDEWMDLYKSYKNDHQYTSESAIWEWVKNLKIHKKTKEASCKLPDKYTLDISTRRTISSKGSGKINVLTMRVRSLCGDEYLMREQEVNTFSKKEYMDFLNKHLKAIAKIIDK